MPSQTILFERSDSRPEMILGRKPSPPTDFEFEVSLTATNKGSVKVAELPGSDKNLRVRFARFYPHLKLHVRKGEDGATYVWSSMK